MAVINNKKDDVTISGSESSDTIDNTGFNVLISGKGGYDKIWNSAASVTIDAGNGNDIVSNTYRDVTILGGAGNDSICNESYTSNVSISGGSDDDTVHNYGENVTVDCGSGNDSLSNHKNKVTIYGGSGADNIYNDADNVMIDLGEGADNFYGWGTGNTIKGGKGDDTIEGCWKNVFVYENGDGNDLILFAQNDDTIQIATNSGYTTQKSGNDLIIKIGSGKMTFKDGIGKNFKIVTESLPEDDKDENKQLLGAVGELMDKISDSEFTDLIEKLTNIASEWGNVEEAGLIKSTIEYLKKVREVFKNPNSDSSGQAKLWELSGASVKEFANFYGVINKHTNATNPLLWGDAAERNIKVLTMAADILSVKASFVSAKAELKEENLLAAITNYADAFRGFGDIALDAYALISKNKNPWNVAEVGVALYKSAVSILDQSTKSHQRYYADGKWDLNDTARFLMDVSMAGIYGITHSLSKEADDVIWDWIIGDDFADSDLTTSEKLSAKLNNLGNNIGNAIGKFGVNVGKALSNMWKQLNTLGYLTGQNIAKAGLNIGNAIGNLLKGAFNKEVVYINADGEVISSSENAVASITMSKTKFTCKALKNTAQNLSLGSKNDTSDWVITTKSGNDKIICASNKNVTVKSGSGNDTVSSTGKGNLYVEAGKGNDSIVGNAGNDKLYGGDGADTLKGGKGNDTLTGGAGKDVFIYTAGNDVIADYATGDKISLNASVSSVSVKGADATFKIGSNTLTVKNGKGKKIIFVDSKGKEREIIGGAFLATNSTSKNNTLASWREVADASERTKAIKIVGNAKDNIILGGSANDSLYGGSGKDSILGNSGKDKLYGQSGNDILKGGAGNDSLWGGAGNDSLWGDSGANTFIYASSEGKDVVYGFENNDLLKITGAFSASYSKSKNEVYFKVGTTSKAITLTDFSASSFNVNGKLYQISGTKLVKK